MYLRCSEVCFRASRCCSRRAWSSWQVKQPHMVALDTLREFRWCQMPMYVQQGWPLAVWTPGIVSRDLANSQWDGFQMTEISTAQLIAPKFTIYFSVQNWEDIFSPLVSSSLRTESLHSSSFQNSVWDICTQLTGKMQSLKEASAGPDQQLEPRRNTLKHLSMCQMLLFR